MDLGATHSITQVVLNWEAAYATAFQIQTSSDGTTWTTAGARIFNVSINGSRC